MLMPLMLAFVVGAERPPDLVVVVLDDLDKTVSEPFVEQIMARTMALKADGVVFDQAFTTTSICCPSRATLLTGKCGHNTGVLTNGGPTGGWKTFHKNRMDEHTVATFLHDGGYRTLAVGKYLNQYEMEGDAPPPIPPGWTQWDVIVDKGIAGYRGYNIHTLHMREGDAHAVVRSHGGDEKDYSTDVFRDVATRFIDEESKQNPNAPLFLYVAPTAPHLPLPPARRHEALARKWEGTVPHNRPNYFSDGDTMADKPAWLRDSWKKRTRGLLERFNGRDWNDRLGSLYAADELIGAVVEHLKAAGRWENALLVVVSDNGYNLGAHALVHKMAPYEESIRVPMMIAGGSGVGIKAGQRDAHWVALADLAPTLLELAHLPVPNDVDGMSLMPLLRKDAPAPSTWRTWLMIEYDGGGAANGHGIGEELHAIRDFFMPAMLLDLPTWRGLRIRSGEKTWKYVEWESGERELYDLDGDPYELDNLAVKKPAEMKTTLAALHEQLEHAKTCKGATCH